MALDHKLEEVKKWLETIKRPPNLSNAKYKTFMHYCAQFVLITNQLWCKDTKMHYQHKMVIPCDRHLFLISSAHNDIGHHGVYTTIALLSEWYWWPGIGGDVAWYIGTCHVCQQ